MRRTRIMVLALGAALALFVPAVAQAQSVVVNNSSSTQSTSTAISDGKHANTTTSGAGNSGVIVAGGLDALSMDSVGSSKSAAAVGPAGASATGDSTNVSDIDVRCSVFSACQAVVNCPGFVCNQVVTPGFGGFVPTTPFIPFPITTTVDTTSNADECAVEGLLGCLLSNPDIGLDLADTLDLGNVLSDLLGGGNLLADLLGTLDLDASGLLGGGLL